MTNQVQKFKKGDIVHTTIWSPSPDYLVTRASRDGKKVDLKVALSHDLVYTNISTTCLVKVK